jgi:glucosamine-6-phosphate deaminase
MFIFVATQSASCRMSDRTKNPVQSGHAWSKVEEGFLRDSAVSPSQTRIPCLVVENFPKLGLIAAMRFLEWAAGHPDGLISLPTGKTPEFFIQWTRFFLQNWDLRKVKEIRKRYGLDLKEKPPLQNLRFVQIDEFYPIPSAQKNSFYHYVTEFYIRGFGLDPGKAQLIQCEKIPLAGGKDFREVFPDMRIDLSLRYRECRSRLEQLQQDSIFLIDQWSSAYEQKIRDQGGIGFFLGGIGPDGHIAFNTRGSDPFSTTRLTETNFETQAVAAGDLGGIEVSSNRLVITIGLETITWNPDAVAIIMAAGEAKAKIVRQSLESDIQNLYPATVLQKLGNGRFYLTRGAASLLSDSMERFYGAGKWTHQKTERAVIDLCQSIQKYGHHILPGDLEDDPYARLIPVRSDVVGSVVSSIIEKMNRGMRKEENQVFLHTGPHHDDIMLGLLPFIANHIRTPSNQFHFAVMTSGFTAVTNQFMTGLLSDTLRFLDQGLIQMVAYPDFFDRGYRLKSDKDVYHYLNKVAAGEEMERRRGVCHRLVRSLVGVYGIQCKDQLRDVIGEVLSALSVSYDGERNPPEIQSLKGMIREFEEELVWAHYGIQVEHVHHLRLGFYQGDIFTEAPKEARDVMPILEMLRKLDPTVLSVAFDPEGSGPDTHYKVLQAIAGALRKWKMEKDLNGLRIWGYRNVWYRFHASEANIIFPVSLNAMSAMGDAFTHCYVSQVDASFPSPELNGKFSDLAEKIWVEQLQDIQLLLGKNHFYQNTHPKIRATHGLIYLKEMGVDEFLLHARALRDSVEGHGRPSEGVPPKGKDNLQ